MNPRIRSMEHIGYLGNSRVVLNHFDAATQADIQHVALSYESEDETMGRIYAKSRRGTALYSKQDIREQYCISDRGLGALETHRTSFFGCLSSHQPSPCSNKTSLLTVCVRQKIPSDENLQELYRRHPAEYAPYPRRPRYPWAVQQQDVYRYEEDVSSNSYFRRKMHVDPARYTWMPSDDESVRMERPRSILDSCLAHQGLPPPPPPVQRPKHVSFARSHTLTSFDDAVVSLSSSTTRMSSAMSRSQERLIDIRKPIIPTPITRQPEPTDNLLVLEKLKKMPMKTQATQTEVCLGRRILPASQLNLSPRTIHRVKMVSQGAQTNGILINGRKLMKSYSEATRFGVPYGSERSPDQIEHEPLQRTQSDEPPRSPFMAMSPPPLPEIPPPPSETSSSGKSEHDSEESESKCQKEIFIDFKPVTFQTKKPLVKTASDGEILLDQRKAQRAEDGIVPEKQITSISHEDITIEEEPRTFSPYFKNQPIRHEGIFKDLGDHVFSSIDESIEGNSLLPQDSIDEEFHENFIYNRMYMRTGSSSDQDVLNLPPKISEEPSPADESVVPSLSFMPDRKLSPFASSDSLANDIRDHSDGIWNESQATVLQADSGTENGTALSSSEMTSLTATSPGGPSTLLTPSSRRKHLLLLQHQQRSSMDTEALEEESPEELPSTSMIITSTKLEVPIVQTHVQEGKQQFLVQRRAKSPVWKRREVQPESPLPAVVPDLLLARTDSGRTNTDISESTTTTDDYITATSGTDSSRKSNSIKGNSQKHRQHTKSQDGSSFESGSSMYSGSKTDYLLEDMVVPSYSPPPIPEETLETAITPVPEIHTGRSSPTGSSSSSGSYSLNGSCPDLPKKPTVPSPKKLSVSEDDRSVHYSSSGYYESPLEDDVTWKSSKSDKTEYYTEETRKKKRPFILEVKQIQPVTKKDLKHLRKYSPSKDIKEKPKRGKIRTRSPMQNHKKPTKKSSTLRSPEEDWLQPDDVKKSHHVTSDESSSGVRDEKKQDHQLSPRKSKKTRDNNRRKSTSRSPTTGMISKGRPRRGNNADDEGKASSLPGSLPRRKSSIKDGRDKEDYEAKKMISHSPLGSPKRRRSPETARLKALSAESLRSVSPGSDSVFYSDPSSHAAAVDHQVHCLHCGKEVDIVTTDDHEKSISSNGVQPDIVQPPAGFADSPRQKHPPGRLYKKLEKRFRSEERTIERRHLKHRTDVRAKSEERGNKAESGKGKLRPMARSTDASMEGLRATDSSPSVLPGAPEDEDDLGLYNVPYTDGYWIYIGDQEEMQTWSRPESAADEEVSRRESISSIESTESEHEFRKKYQAVTHRMVHRKSCLEMYKRQASKSFEYAGNNMENILADPPSDENELKQRLEGLLKLMLLVWCRENAANKLLSGKTNESDKTVIVRRQSGEFGFRIHGSKPVVVSAIELDTPAESSGLEVGDIVLSVNGISVLDKSHSEVVKIAHAGSDTLTLEVARTCGVLSPTSSDTQGTPVHSGYLWKLGGFASGVPTNKWIRRYFSLKRDNCLYFYKTDADKQPVGAIMLQSYGITKEDDETKPNRFCISRPGVPTLHLAADTDQSANRWMELLTQAAEESRICDTWLEQARRNLTLPPNSIPKPDCFGYLVKLGTQWKSWSRIYCVLKDACLYFYQDANSKSAFGVACLHGYKVQQSTSGSKKHAFEMIPSEPSQKHYYFHTESDMDRKRWLAALEYSIDRWLKVG